MTHDTTTEPVNNNEQAIAQLEELYSFMQRRPGLKKLGHLTQGTVTNDFTAYFWYNYDGKRFIDLVEDLDPNTYSVEVRNGCYEITIRTETPLTIKISVDASAIAERTIDTEMRPVAVATWHLLSGEVIREGEAGK